MSFNCSHVARVPRAQGHACRSRTAVTMMLELEASSTKHKRRAAVAAGLTLLLVGGRKQTPGKQVRHFVMLLGNVMIKRIFY